VNTSDTAERRVWGRRGTAGATIAARLSFENVTHGYDGVPALRGVSLIVEPGETLCLLGRSGSGKTTLLRVAAGLERPASGRVLIDDREVSGPRTFVPPEKRGVGLMFQDYALFPHLTVLRNVMFGLTAMPRADAEREALRVLGRVGLERHAHDYPHALSGGEQQRAALARAIVPRPAVLLMDEPFSGLDRSLREEVREETHAIIRETRATCIIVTHDPEEAMHMGNRVGLMRDGRLVQLGTAESLYRRPNDLLAARFLSDINEFDCVVKDGSVVTPLGRLACGAHAEGASVVVGIRPQGIRLAAANGVNGSGAVGRVIAENFLGEVDHLEIAINGLEGPIRARVRADMRFPEGSEVNVSVDPREVVIFAKPGE
jgi:iron(III) transport system ATP-binding protein